MSSCPLFVVEENVDNQELAKRYVATLPEDLLFFKVVLPVTEARSNPDGEMWLSIEASGPEGDSHGSRMSDAALQRMVGYIERGWNGERLPYLDGHYRDLLAAELGTIHNPRLTEDRHLAVSAQLDPENPQAVRLYKSILKGRKHGASIAGFVHSFRIEKREDSDEQDFVIDDIEVIEISRTSYPSWKASFTTMLVQNAVPIQQAVPMVLPMIERRFNAFGDTPGLIQCEATGEGSWVCKRIKNKSFLGASQQSAKDVPSSAEVCQDTQGSKRELVSKLSADGQDVQLSQPPPGCLGVALTQDTASGELREVHSNPEREEEFLPVFSGGSEQETGNQLKELSNKSVKIGGRAMEEELLETVDPTADIHVSESEAEVTPEVEERSQEEPAAVERCEETAETVEETPVEVRSSLQEKVSARMKARELSEYMWTAQSMLSTTINDANKEADERVAATGEILDDLVAASKPVAAELARMGPSPDMSVLWAEKSELTDAKFSRSRVDAIQKAMDVLLVEFAELQRLLSAADIEEKAEEMVIAAVETVETEEERPNAIKAAVEQQMAQLRTEFMERIESLQQRHKDNLKEVLETVAEITEKPEAPKGAVRTETAPEDRARNIKQAFYQSVSG